MSLVALSKASSSEAGIESKMEGGDPGGQRKARRCESAWGPLCVANEGRQPEGRAVAASGLGANTYWKPRTSTGLRRLDVLLSPNWPLPCGSLPQ